MMNRIIRTSVKTTRTLRNSTLFTESFQSRNTHFYVVQWPNQSLSLRNNNEDACSDEDYLSTVMRYAEMQYNAMNNVKEKPSQPLTFNISSQAMKELSLKLDLSDAEKKENKKMSTRNVQLNKIMFIDRTATVDENKIVALQPVVQKQDAVHKKKKRSPKDTTAAVAEIVAIKKESEPQEE